MLWFQVVKLITGPFLKIFLRYTANAVLLGWHKMSKHVTLPIFLSQITKYLLKRILWDPTKILVSFKVFLKIFLFDHLLCMSKDVLVFVLFLLPPPLLQKAAKFFGSICLNNIASKHKHQRKYNPLSSMYSILWVHLLQMLNTTASSLLCSLTASQGSALILDWTYKIVRILANL